MYLLVTMTLAGQILVAAESEGMANVVVGDFALAPAGDLRFSEQRFEVHPKVLVGSGWDSNALGPAGDGKSDTFVRGIFGFLVRYHPHHGLDGDLDAEFERQDHRNTSALNRSAGLLRSNVDYVTPELVWHGDLGWKRSQETLVTTGDQVTQDRYQFRSQIKHDSALWGEKFTIDAGHIDYRQGTTSFDARQGDHSTFATRMEIGQHNGPDYHLLALEGELVRYTVDDRFNDCAALTMTVGELIAASPRSNLHLEIGLEMRRYADNYLHDSGNNDRLALAPWLNLGGIWSWREGNQLGARLYSDLTDSLTSNATWRRGGEILSRTNLSARLVAEAIVDVSDQRDGGLNRQNTVQRQVAQASIAGRYALAEGLATRLKATAVQVQSPAGGGYRRLNLSLDLAYVY